MNIREIKEVIANNFTIVCSRNYKFVQTEFQIDYKSS